MPLSDASRPPGERPIVFCGANAEHFAREILPLEPALRAYLRVRFPGLQDCDAVIQEAYACLERARSFGGTRQPRRDLFSTALRCAKARLRETESLPSGKSPRSAA